MVSSAASHSTEQRMTRRPQYFMDVQNMTQARSHGVLQTRKQITHGGAVVIGTGVDRIFGKTLMFMENYFFIPMHVIHNPTLIFYFKILLYLAHSKCILTVFCNM